MAEDTADLTINSLQIVSSPIFHVDDNIFAELAADLSPQPAATLLLIFRDLLNQWSLRVQSGRFLSSVILQFERVMMLHGVPMEVNLDNRWFKQRSIHRHSFAYLIPAYEYMPRRSLAALYKDLSRLEDRLHWQIWMGTEEEDHRKFHQLRIGYQGERGQILHLVRNLNYRGFAAHYSYSLFTRMYQCHRARTQVLSVYTALLGSLQTIVAPQRVNDVDFSEKLFQLAENCARSLGTLKDCPLFAFLSEILIALLVFDGLNAAVAMTGIELRCDKRFKNFKHFCYWQPYRRLLAYIMLEKDPGNLVIDAQILGEELEGQLGVMEDAAASVFAEAAIRLYVKKGLYDKFMNCVARYAKQVPRRAKGLLEYLQTTEYVEETDVVIDNACDPMEYKLHPSEELWVRWCEKRLKSPARYGPLVEVYTNCCRVLFQFLDFGQNRANERAWWALLFVIQAVDQETVDPLWVERLDWWPAFHHEGILLSETAKDCRDVIFRVLRKELRRP